MRYQKFYPPRTCPRLFYFACLWKNFLYAYCSTSFSYCQRVIRIFLIIVCLHKGEGVVMDTLDKIMLLLSDYFNVSTDYLLGRTDIKNPPAETEGLIFHIKDDNLRADVDELVSIYLSLDSVLISFHAVCQSKMQLPL